MWESRKGNIYHGCMSWVACHIWMYIMGLSPFDIIGIGI